VEESKTEGERLARVALDERGLQSLADQGDASAQEALGGMYFSGLGVAKDAREGVAWWRKSAEQGEEDLELWRFVARTKRLQRLTAVRLTVYELDRWRLWL
jgi:TPR repeat protein